MLQQLKWKTIVYILRNEQQDDSTEFLKVIGNRAKEKIPTLKINLWKFTSLILQENGWYEGFKAPTKKKDQIEILQCESRFETKCA